MKFTATSRVGGNSSAEARTSSRSQEILTEQMQAKSRSQDPLQTSPLTLPQIAYFDTFKAPLFCYTICMLIAIQLDRSVSDGRMDIPIMTKAISHGS